MLLTDQMIKNTRPGEKPLKLVDGYGLFLLVQPNGGRWWRMRFRVDGVEKQLSLGVYPLITLKRAREKREAIRLQLADGINPCAVRKAEKRGRANTFEAVAREWMEKRKRIWSEGY